MKKQPESTREGGREGGERLLILSNSEEGSGTRGRP